LTIFSTKYSFPELEFPFVSDGFKEQFSIIVGSRFHFKIKQTTMRITSLQILSFFGFLGLLSGSFSAFSQAPTAANSTKINFEHWKKLMPRNVGPATMSGRVTAIDVDVKNDIIYIGAASGGVWRSKGGGISFEPIFDNETTQSIGAIAVNAANPSEIWVGSGEGNPRNSQNFGNGIYKSIDGGKTWKNKGLTTSRAIHRIVINPKNTDEVVVGVIGSAYGGNDERGIFKTSDGGKTWRKVLFINDQTGCADLVGDPQNPNKLVAAMWEYGRKPWTFSSGGKGSGIYISHDGGETWERRTDRDGLPKGELGRCGLAICRTKPNVVYALVEAKENAIYRSDDGGTKWRKVGANGDRPFYYAEIYCDPKNENRLYNIFSRVGKSEDGGKTWIELLDYNRVHPDHHAWWIHPENPNYMIDGNDGGIAITRDGGETWQYGANLPLGQFYHVNLDNEVPYNLYGGLQDNGSWVGPSAIWRSGGIRNADWQELYFGDGFDVMPRADNNRFIYAMSQGGNLAYIDKNTGAGQGIQPQHPEGVTLRYNWNAALAQNPFEPKGIYYGSQFVHKSSDFGQTWRIISPDLSSSDTAKINASQRTGGLTPDVTNAENHCTILAIAPSPVNEKTIWVSTDDGNLQLTRDGGTTWQNLSAKLPDMPKGAWIPQIEVSPKNADEAWVIVNNYRQNDWKPYAYHTTDGGRTFRRIVKEGQVEAYTLSFTVDLVEPNLWFLGTDFGLYFSTDAGQNWVKWTQGLPSVPIFDMKIHPRDGDLVLGTFGRAFWIFDDIRPLRAFARTQGRVLEKNLAIFEAPDAYLAKYRSYDGERFQADAIYEGRNRSPLSMLTIWKKPKTATDVKTEKKDDKKDGDKAKIQIFDAKGDTVRTFKTELDSGFNRVYWTLQRTGVRFPSWEDAKPDADEPSGLSVLPGTYKVVVTLGSERDSTMVTVKADPRATETLEDMRGREAALLDLQKLIGTSTKAFDRLKEADKTIGLVEAQFTNSPTDSVKTNLIKLGKSLKDSILTIQKMFMLTRDAKGINRQPNGLTDKIFKAYYLMSSGTSKPQSNALIANEDARKRATQVFERMNAFFEKDWATYKAKVEAVQYSLFKKIEPIKLD
jgi:photosystem II stability/assembly factor-like uncharacterized protein